MNWYSKLNVFASVDPVEYLEYNPDVSGWTLFVKFRENDKIYSYKDVSPFVYEKIEKLRRKKNYPKVTEILRNLSGSNKPKETKNKPVPNTQPQSPTQLKLF